MFTRRFFIILLLCALLSLVGGVVPGLHVLALVLVSILALLTIVDAIFAVMVSRHILTKREVSQLLSLAQPNKVSYNVELQLSNRLQRNIEIETSDSPPPTFVVHGQVSLRGNGTQTYSLLPMARGRYEFGAIRCFVRSVFPGLFEWRNFSCRGQVVKVYPTFRNLKQLETESEIHNQHGMQRVRHTGNSTEFEQIRDYVPGDDVRTINWRATARTALLKVNTYTEERSRQIIPIVCAGPSMLVADSGVSLLDRAVSAAVALGDSAIRHYDEAGLITVTHQGVNRFMPPERSRSTVARMLEITSDFGLPPTPLETQYTDDTDVLPDDLDRRTLNNLVARIIATEADPDFENLANYILANIKQRSLLVLFANFNNITMANKTIPALRRIASRHSLVVVLFRNKEVEAEALSVYRSSVKVSEKISDQRMRTLCGDYMVQQQVLATQLRRHRINVVLTDPDHLSSAVLGAYLDIKNRNTF